MRKRIKKYEPTSKVYEEDDYPSSISSAEFLQNHNPYHHLNFEKPIEETKEFSSLATYIPN